MATTSKTIVILSISSDIGAFLGRRYLDLGYRVIGTYRVRRPFPELDGHPNCRLFPCDLNRLESVRAFCRKFRSLKISWDVLISCTGDLLPALPFFEADFSDWSRSVNVNAVGQLGVVHGLHPYRNKRKADVVLFAGGGANNTVVNLSAYAISKIMLTKMCEFLDAENKDMNFFIVGPGWTRTKIHDPVLKDRRVARAKYLETKAALDHRQGTPLPEIFDCIEWLRAQGKKVVGGRNFSIVYDPWRLNVRGRLLKQLKSDPDMYKLRRHGNSFLQPVKK